MPSSTIAGLIGNDADPFCAANFSERRLRWKSGARCCGLADVSSSWRIIGGGSGAGAVGVAGRGGAGGVGGAGGFGVPESGAAGGIVVGVKGTGAAGALGVTGAADAVWPNFTAACLGVARDHPASGSFGAGTGIAFVAGSMS